MDSISQPFTQALDYAKLDVHSEGGFVTHVRLIHDRTPCTVLKAHKECTGGEMVPTLRRLRNMHVHAASKHSLAWRLTTLLKTTRLALKKQKRKTALEVYLDQPRT
jgi:hypothetical protein